MENQKYEENLSIHTEWLSHGNCFGLRIRTEGEGVVLGKLRKL